MKARPLYCLRYGSPSYHQARFADWEWAVTDGVGGPVLAKGHTLTEWGAKRAIERTVCRCVPVSGVCRCDRPVLHRLTHWEAVNLTEQLRHDDCPVTVRVDNPAGEVVLWPAVALTSRQEAHTLRLVTRVTDAPVHWAGAAR